MDSNIQLNSNDGTSEDSSIIQELKHLKMRVERIVNIIKLSPGSLCTPLIWQENCVNAVGNCIHEWRTIVSFHKLTSADSNEDSRFSDATMDQIKSASLEIFMLIQQTLQVGPLSGSRPGYFKRCGSQVATIAYHFLTQSLGENVCHDLLFTHRQRDVISQWTRDAEKAMLSSDEKPSKTSTLKQMQIGTGTKTKKIFSKD